MSACPHDFATRLQRFDDQRRAIHNRGFALGVVTTLAVLGLVALWVCVGGNTGLKAAGYKVSGVDSDTRGMRLFQCGRPVEIGATGDTRRHPGLGGSSAQYANELAVVTRPLRDLAKTANPCQPSAIPGLTL